MTIARPPEPWFGVEQWERNLLVAPLWLLVEAAAAAMEAVVFDDDTVKRFAMVM